MISRWCRHIESWWQQTPLPTANTAKPMFQNWNNFDQGQWKVYFSSDKPGTGTAYQWAGSFRLVSWNVNADAPLPASRMAALLLVVEKQRDISVIFLQEVSKEALTALLADPWIQKNWYTSEADDSSFKDQKFITVTLVSKSWLTTHCIVLGAVWRIPLPSRFKRDALCCDFIVNTSGEYPLARRSLRVRLINVHLDSLPIRPSLRPQQLSIVASYLNTVDCGLVAGDFNPVLPEDEDLICANQLVDSWTLLHPNDPGFTWGLHGVNPFPPNRLDKVAVWNMTPERVSILPTHGLEEGEANTRGSTDREAQFSDHYGLVSDLRWEEDRSLRRGKS